MKQVKIILIAATLLISACKKSNTSPKDCDRITEINGYAIDYDSKGRLIKYYLADASSWVTVAYESNNTTITETYSNRDGEKYQYRVNENGYVVTYKAFDKAGKLLRIISIIRDGNGYIIDRKDDEYFADGSINPALSRKYTYTNTVENGNLVKVVLNENGSIRTTEYIYDKNGPFIKAIENPGDLLHRFGNPQSKNKLLKVTADGLDLWGYTYTSDAKGRLIYYKRTPLSGGRGAEATIKYQCD